MAATAYKDFAGQTCSKSKQVKIAKIAETAFTTGPMKGYVNVTVTMPNGETATAPMPSELLKKVNVGDLACKTTFLDED